MLTRTRTRALRSVVLLVLVVGAVLGAAPARAGGWAATVLDATPDRMEPGQTYTLKYWILQHGTHSYWGQIDDLGKTGLRLVDTEGKSAPLTFAGTPLKEHSHFAAEVTVPQAGRWQVVAMQGWFEDDLVGALTVPGGFEAVQRPTGPVPADSEWAGDAVRPPYVVTEYVPRSILENSLEAPPAPAQPEAAAGPQPAAQPASQPAGTGATWLPAAGALTAVLVVAAIVAVDLRSRRTRVTRGAIRSKDPHTQQA